MNDLYLVVFISLSNYLLPSFLFFLIFKLFTMCFYYFCNKKKYIKTSNGAISLLITLLIKFKGKRRQLNKKYTHSLGQHNLIFILLSAGGGVSGGERV